MEALFMGNSVILLFLVYINFIIEVLEDLQDYPKVEPYYWEFVGLYKDVFVAYFYDEENEKIYQCSAIGEAYCLTKGSPQWLLMADVIPDVAVVVDRKFAESMEDAWNQ